MIVNSFFFFVLVQESTGFIQFQQFKITEVRTDDVFHFLMICLLFNGIS